MTEQPNESTVPSSDPAGDYPDVEQPQPEPAPEPDAAEEVAGDDEA